MPVLAKGSKGGKGKKGGGKKGAVKVVPDPDAAYKQQLDETYYIPKPSREKLSREYVALVDAAIKANTVSVTSVPTGDYVAPSQVPLMKIPEIVRSLGLCATDAQLEQISCMVAATATAASDANKDDGNNNGDGVQLLPSTSFADTEKLRQVLSEALHTHVLAYDAQVLARPDPRFPTRVSSVIYCVSERDLVSCFESIWEATGKKSILRKDQSDVRCFTVEELEAVMEEAQKNGSSVAPLSRKELDDLYFFIKGEGDDVIAEDTFLNCLTDVK